MSPQEPSLSDEAIDVILDALANWFEEFQGVGGPLPSYAEAWADMERAKAEVEAIKAARS